MIEAASSAGGGSESEQWCDAYRVMKWSDAKVTVFDFTDVETIPEEHWIEAQKCERKEIAHRDEYFAKAEHDAYETGRILHERHMPKATLLPGEYSMPLVGLGTWKAEKGQVRDAVYSALKAGYRHIDCASVYQNEDEVGDAIHHVVAKNLITRQDLFICSKVWNSDHGARRVRQACEASLKALKVDYLDLYLIHWPVSGNVGDTVSPPIKETWQAMEGLVRDGLVRSIGVSNFSAAKLADILSYASVRPSVCQVEVHPYHRNDALIAFCKEHQIHVTAFSPLGSPDSESIFPRKVSAVLMQDPRVQRVAERTGKNVGQVLIRWALQHGTSVIPKSTNPSRIAGNLDVLDWELSASDFALISGIAFQMRMVNGGMWLNPRGPYRTMEDLWDEPEYQMTDKEYQQDIESFDKRSKSLTHPIDLVSSSEDSEAAADDSSDEYQSASGSAPVSANASPVAKPQGSFLGNLVVFSRRKK